MSDSAALERRQVVLRVFYCWAAYVIVTLCGSHVASLAYGRGPLESIAFITGTAGLLCGWLIASIFFGNWATFANMRIPRMALTIVVAATLLAAAQNVVITAATRRPLTWTRFGALFHPALLDVTVLFGLGFGFQVFDANRRRELAQSRLETELARAQVQLLRAQLQPHFLFNSLHAISSRVATAPTEAQTMIARLGALLRMSTDSATESHVTLGDELQFLSAYLDLQKLRFGDRLRVALDVPQELLHARVPSFLLQPAAENAVRHAVEHVDGPVTIGITARLERGVLHLSVWNDGPPLGPDPSKGVGLRNTEVRLAQLYGTRAVFTIANRAEGGVTSDIRIPFEQERSSAAV